MNDHPAIPILLVDDDCELAAMVQCLFERHALSLEHAATLAAARRRIDARLPALVLLDIMLPDGSGLDACREWRARFPGLPVLLLTARGDPMDRVVGLEVGADDYVPKPFEGRELVARARALLRRAALLEEKSSPLPTSMRIGSMTLDFRRLAVRAGQSEVILPPGEFRLLAALARLPGQAMDRQALASEIQPGRYRPLERAVDVQVARLRRKLRDRLGLDPIHTVRGAGYVLLAPDGDARR